MRLSFYACVAGTAILLSGCGGGSDAVAARVQDEVADRARQIAEFTAQAEAAEALARSLAVDTPCASDDQCAAVTFSPTLRGACARRDFYALYSTRSATAAAAQAAAKEQNARAADAVALQPVPVDGLCPAVIYLVAPACVASRCVNAAP